MSRGFREAVELTRLGGVNAPPFLSVALEARLVAGHLNQQT
jgi:hypothetical protein